MSSVLGTHDQGHLHSVFLCGLQALPSREVPGVEAQISACTDCRQEVETLRPIVGAFVSWPTDVLRPSVSLWERLAQRIAVETGKAPVLRHDDRSNRNGKKPRRASRVSCSRRIRGKRVAACWCGWRRGATIRPIAMPESKSCIGFTASCSWTTRSSIPVITSGQRPAASIVVSGARPAVPVFSLRRPTTSFSDPTKRTRPCRACATATRRSTTTGSLKGSQS
jgi:hypothetical protein